MNNGKTKLIKAIIFLTLIFIGLIFICFKNKTEEQEIYKIRKEALDLSKIPNNEELTQKKEDLLRKKTSLDFYLFDKDNPVSFIEIIEGLGSQNLLVTDVSKVELIEEDLVLEASLKGSFQNIMNFISIFRIFQ
jgi:hypothetical protein